MDGGKLELIQALSENNQPQPFTPPTLWPHFCPHLALQTDSLDQVLAMVKDRGLALAHGPIEYPGIVKWLYITDPDQNVIEFFQDLAGH
jgi:lactoylglutathione lyase